MHGATAFPGLSPRYRRRVGWHVGCFMPCHAERSSLKETAIMKKTLSIAALFLVAMTGNALADADYSIATKAPSAKVDARAVATISVQPKGPYHINKEFPTKLTIDAPDGVKIEKAKQSAKDAVKFGDTAAEFQAEIIEEFGAGTISVHHMLSYTHCILHSVCRQVDDA